jgi:hypothetical protein
MSLIALMMEAARTSETLVNLVPLYAKLQSRSRPSAFSWPWEPQIVYSFILSSSNYSKNVLPFSYYDFSLLVLSCHLIQNWCCLCCRYLSITSVLSLSRACAACECGAYKWPEVQCDWPVIPAVSTVGVADSFSH